MMKVNADAPEDFIFTSDLTYTSPNDRYTYQFTYLGDGVFSLISKGTLDDKCFKHQLSSGDKARERLKALHPSKMYHLVWDVTELKKGSVLARYMAISKLKTDNHIESLTMVGANSFIRNFGAIAGKLVPRIKLFFVDTFQEAVTNLNKNLHKRIPVYTDNNTHLTSNSDSYSRFLSVWQDNPDYISYSDEQYKITTKQQWQYTAKDNTFRVKVSLIEALIVYFDCEGYMKPLHVDICYDIEESILKEIGCGPENKFYAIVDIKKMRGVSLGARKRISYYENIYKGYFNMVATVANPTMSFLLRLLRKISLDNFAHWIATDTKETALGKILVHQKGNTSHPLKHHAENQETPLIIPEDPAEMVRLIKKQHKELTELKNNQQEQVGRITEIIGRMTWDESFELPVISAESQNPFYEVYNSLTVLFQDFKEIIHEKHLHTQKLIESEDKYRNLINLANDVIIVYQDDRIKFLNNRVEQSLGYRPEDLIGRSMDNLVAPEEVARLRDYHLRRIKGDDIPWIYETVFIHRNGQRVPVSMSVGLITFENRLAALVISRDITQKKKNDEELERYRNHLEDIIKQRTLQLQKEISERKVAEEADRLKSAFLANMSHEIRTPMNAIISFSNFLKEPDIPAEQHEEYLNYILSSGQSLLNLINDIIDFSKIQAKQLNILETNCYINPLLEELYKLFEESRKAHNKNITLVVSIPDKEKNVALYTDPYRLKQIISNLLDNALKFTDSGSITFGYELQEEHILLFVKDTGIGIPEDKKEFVFKRFGKIENMAKNLGGTGLGLAISKHLTLLLNGKIWVESELGKGSQFYLKLPYNHSLESMPAPAAPTIFTTYHDWKGKNILIAEDEDLNFKVLQIALKKTHASILRANNGVEAVEIAKAESDIHLILMDIQMPMMDGYEAMQTIKKLKPELPIIAQTAFALLEEQQRCIDLGFNDYIAKPIDTTELFRKIEMQLFNK